MSNYFIGYAKSVAVGSNKTLAEADSGVVQYVTANATITLPATAVGLTFIVAQAPGAVASISPAAADKIMGNGFTSADNKDMVGPSNFGGTAYVVLHADGVNGYHVGVVNGTWTREA